jgi:hypothetical protein
MGILENAAVKINAFNNYNGGRDLHRAASYHDVLNARAGRGSFVQETGIVEDQYLVLIDRALRSYFSMNRGNRMGSTEEFVAKLNNKLQSDKIRNILGKLKELSITSPNIEDYKSNAEELYGSFSNSKNGLSNDRTSFCVGATKTMHCLFPELFIMLDQNVAKALEYPSGQYNNFASYWKAMKICRHELTKWRAKYGSTDSLLQLDLPPTTLTRVFDKCASIMGVGGI